MSLWPFRKRPVPLNEYLLSCLSRLTNHELSCTKCQRYLFNDGHAPCSDGFVIRKQLGRIQAAIERAGENETQA